jgi:hypothetical protein
MSSTDGLLRGEFQHLHLPSLEFSAERATVLTGRQSR